jgi:glycerol-3-phosphate dehydrogenase (NAD(P)+)
MKKMPVIGVIGGGSWATAIVKVLQKNPGHINWFIRSNENIEFIRKNKHNPHYLRAVMLDPEKLNISNDINYIAKESDILIFVIPAAFLKETLEKLSEDISEKTVVSAIKGVIPGDNLLISDFFNKYFNLHLSSIVILSGPSHAEEVAMERLSYLTFASADIKLARSIANIFEIHYIKTIVSGDIYGIEYASVLKNIFAIAAGICHGLGYGDNFQAVLISNAIQEIKRFVDTVRPTTRDIKSSVYLGDLIVTAYSQFSRNRTFGNMIGKGYSVKAAILELSMVAEGYYATKCIYEINKKHFVNMPVTDAVYNILYDNISPAIEMKLLTKSLG